MSDERQRLEQDLAHTEHEAHAARRTGDLRRERDMLVLAELLRQQLIRFDSSSEDEAEDDPALQDRLL